MIPTVSQGHWSEFRNSHGTTLLQITFTWKEDDRATNLRQHLLQQLSPGLYRTTDNWQVFYVPDEFRADAPIRREGLSLFHVDQNNDHGVKHFFLWLHPGKPLAFVSLLHEGKIQFGRTGITDLADNGPKNGKYAYAFSPEDSADMWSLQFHAAGKEATETTLLIRESDDGTVWRAAGDHTGIFDDESIADLKYWRISAIRLL